MNKIFLSLFLVISLISTAWANNGWYSTLQGTASDVEQDIPSDGVILQWSSFYQKWLFAYGVAPSGGTTGQVLTKNSGSNYDYSWTTYPTAPAGGANAIQYYLTSSSLGGSSNATLDGSGNLVAKSIHVGTIGQEAGIFNYDSSGSLQAGQVYWDAYNNFYVSNFYVNGSFSLPSGILAIGSTAPGPAAEFFMSNSGTSSPVLEFMANVFGSPYIAFNGDGSASLATGAFTVGSTGVTTALSFVKTGGTSSQFLKANGSVDSSTYLTGTKANSVSNSDGTLTISPTTGAVVASLALGHANTWTATQTFSNTITGSISGNAATATTAGTVTTAAQTAITSVGTLSSLTMGGTITGKNSGYVDYSSITCGNSVTAGTAVGTGTTPSYTAPTAGKIISATLTGSLNAGNCSCVIDVWKTNAALPTVTNTITGGAYPTLSTQTHATTTLTSWSTGVNIAANDVIMCNVNSCTCDNWNLVMGIQK